MGKKQKIDKQLKISNNIYYTAIYSNLNDRYSLYRRFILLSGECKTRQATQEELDKYKHLIKS